MSVFCDDVWCRQVSTCHKAELCEGVFGSGQWQYSLAAQFTVVSGNRTDLYSVGA